MTWSGPERTCLFQDLRSEIPGGLRAGTVFSAVLSRSCMESTVILDTLPSYIRMLAAQKSVAPPQVRKNANEPIKFSDYVDINTWGLGSNVGRKS